MKINASVKSILFLSFLLVDSIAQAAPPYATNVNVLQNFDNMIPTPQNEIPVSADGWTYYLDIGYTRTGWQKDTVKFYIYDASARRVWANYQYVQISDQVAIRGNSMEQVITGGVRDETTNDQCGKPLANKAEYLQYLADGIDPACQDKSYMLGEGYIYFSDENDTPFVSSQGANRLSVYVKTPEYFSIGGDADDFPQRNLDAGPYSTVGGGHFYHYYYLESKGGWMHMLVDTHPTHNNTFGMDGHLGYDESYFNGMFSFYIRAWNEAENSLSQQGSGIAPYPIYYDEIEFYNDPEPQNDQTINSPGVAFDPATETFNICFNDKYWNFNSPASYQVKYSFAPITNANFNAAKNIQVQADTRFGGITANTTGIISKTSNYRNMLWASFTLLTEDKSKVTAGQRIYFAIKDITNRDYTNTQYDAANDLATTTVDGLGDIREVDLIKRIDYQPSLVMMSEPQIKKVIIQ